MGGVARKKQTAMAHRLENIGAQRRDRFLDRGAARHCGGGLRSEADGEFVPDPLVRPVFDFLIQRNLNVIPAARHRAHRSKGEAARMVRIDEFMIARRHIGENAEPAERIDALIFAASLCRYRLA